MAVNLDTNGQAVVNTDNGTITGRTGSIPDGSGVIDQGDYWVAWIRHEATSSAGRQFYVYIAVNTDASSTWAAGTTGTCIVDAVQLEVGKFATSFIETTTTATTRNKSELSFASAGVINDTEGSVLLDWTPRYRFAAAPTAGIASLTSTSRLLYHTPAAKIAYYDGVNSGLVTSSFVGDTTTKLGVTWEGIVYKIFVDGALEKTGVYDGSLTDGGTFYLGQYGGIGFDTANYTNVKVYTKALSDAEMITETT